MVALFLEQNLLNYIKKIFSNHKNGSNQRITHTQNDTS